MAFGRQVLASGAVVWKRVLCIPPMQHGVASAWPGAINKLRLKRPGNPLLGGRTEETVPVMALGQQVIATGVAVWKRVLRIPPIQQGALALGLVQ